MLSQHQKAPRGRSVARGVVFAACLLAASPPTLAQQASLEGTWSGGGTVILPSGDRERARCRVTFRRVGNGFGMNANCATSSTRVAQTAELSRISATRFSGQFYNAEYSISGSIVISVQGNHLSASLNGGGGSAYFNLSR